MALPQKYILSDYPTLTAFLRKEPAVTIAVPIDAQGGLHAASLLYWHTPDPLAFYLVTHIDTIKCTLLKAQKEIPCAAVIGTYKNTEFTLQMHGTLTIAAVDSEFLEPYYQKRGNRHDQLGDPDVVCLVFRPTWARFTDYAKGYDQFFLET